MTPTAVHHHAAAIKNGGCVSLQEPLAPRDGKKDGPVQGELYIDLQLMPEIDVRHAELSITILSGAKLAAKDHRGTSDPYVCIVVGDQPPYQTAVVRKTLDPSWDETAVFSVVPLPDWPTIY